MKRDSAGLWFTLAGISLAFAGLALTQSWGVRTSDRAATAPAEIRAAAATADKWQVAVIVLAVLAALLAGIGIAVHFRRPRIKFRTTVDNRGDEAGLSLLTRDGESIDSARCKLTKGWWRWRRERKGQKERDPTRGARVEFAYPRDFESTFSDGVLDKGRCVVVWEARLRNRRTGRLEHRRVARGHLRITDELRAAAERLRDRGTWRAHSERMNGETRLSLVRREEPITRVQCGVRSRAEDGSLGEAFLGYAEGEGAGEVTLLFPSDFRREVGQTKRPMPGGGFQIVSQYEYPSGDPGEYEVLWKVVWMAQGGSVDPDKDPFEQLRREVAVAQDGFGIAR